MKKFLCLALAGVLMLLSLGAVAEPAADLIEGYGSIDEVGGWIATYCNEWDDIFGSTFGADLSFDPSNISITSRRDTSFTADMDGVIMELDNDMNIYSIRVDLADASRSSYATLARGLAVNLVLFYDPPQTREEMKDRFMQLMEQYLDSLEYFSGMIKIVGNKPYSTSVSLFLDDVGFNSMPEMFFCKVDNELYFSTHDLAA